MRIMFARLFQNLEKSPSTFKILPKHKKIEQFDLMERSKYCDTIHILMDVRSCWNSALGMLSSMLKLKSGIMSSVHHLKMVDGIR